MAATASTFAALQQRVTPRWMKRPKVKALVSQLYLQADLVVDRLAGAIEARCVELCPNDALDPIGSTCGLERAPAESDDSYRAYLRDPFARWHTSGTLPGIVAELAHVGLTAEVWSYWDLVDLGVDPAVAFGGISSFFFVYLPYYAPFADPKIWKGGAFLGGDWAGLSYWGVSDVYELLPAATRAVERWKDASTSCRFIAIARDNSGAVTDAGFTGSVEIIPMMEPWEIGSNGAQMREFYNYSYLRERVT